ncbi:hypothetical protein CCP3SC15_1630007 [Gammaproteobacteria bacterium]
MTNVLNLLPRSPAAIAKTGMDGLLTSHQPLPDAWIERLFSRLTAFYGARFADMWRGVNSDEFRKVWAQELGGYTAEEIYRGIQACRTRDWPPTLPEFLKLCRPPIDLEAAYHEAIRQLARRETGDDQWSHPAIFWASAQIGTVDMRLSNWGSIKQRWISVLNSEIDKGRWDEIPKRINSLPPPGKLSVSPEEAKKRLNNIFSMLAGKMST